MVQSGADLGADGSGGERPPSGIRLPAGPKGFDSPLCTILRYQILVTDPKKFSKGAIGANTY